MTYVGVENLVKKYGTEEAAVMAVRGISFEAHPGDWIAFMGESGSGKSTLLSMLGALNTPTSGKYRVDGVDVYSLAQEERADFRRTYLGFVFQSFHLVPYLTVRENVMLPPVKIRGRKRARPMRPLQVGLRGQPPAKPISGGEQERVAVARS
jgi:putative ABC transport system ATP-binding protein